MAYIVTDENPPPPNAQVPGPTPLPLPMTKELSLPRPNQTETYPACQTDSRPRRRSLASLERETSVDQRSGRPSLSVALGGRTKAASSRLLAKVDGGVVVGAGGREGGGCVGLKQVMSPA